MNDKVNTVVIGKLIKEELQRQGKTSVWLDKRAWLPSHQYI